MSDFLDNINNGNLIYEKDSEIANNIVIRRKIYNRYTGTQDFEIIITNKQNKIDSLNGEKIALERRIAEIKDEINTITGI